jgi:hypothetical protein
MLRFASALGLVLAGMAVCVDAQWLEHRDSKTPRTADGRPNLSASVPRFSGKPDVSGVWQSERTSVEEFARVQGPRFTQMQIDFGDVTKHVVNVFWGLKPEEEPVRPETVAIRRQRQQSGEGFQGASCLPPSLPVNLFLFPFKMIQARGEIVVIPGSGDPPRQIYTDGRSLPKDPEPSWTGHSVGSWQDDTLVVQTVGINTRAWLDGAAHLRSEGMRITERYRRRDFGHMDLELTFDDPKYYTQPFGIKTTLMLMPDSDVLDYVCAENEKDLVHYKR